MIIAPTINALTGFDGIPKVSNGIKDVCAPALLADSGAATPSMAPLPNWARFFETFFSMEYAAKEPKIEPLPGRMPNAEPIIVPRRMGAIMRFQSSLVGHRPVIFVIITER